MQINISDTLFIYTKDMSDTENKQRIRKKNINTEQEETDINIIDGNVQKMLNDEIRKNVDDVRDDYQHKLYQYIGESQRIIDEYKKITRKIGQKPFMKTKEKVDNTELLSERTRIYNSFIELINRFGYTKIINRSASTEKCTRDGCDSTEFNQGDSCVICLKCGLQTENISHQTNFSDGERINMNKKYKYGMRIHFRDTLNQFQGKQNKYIEPDVYKALEKTFEIHNLVNKEGKTREEKYSKITKEYIRAFLQETDYKKYYEDIVMLHEYYTGIKPINLTNIENDLMADFDAVEKVYKELPETSRKRLNFLNNQYILYQFLRRRGIKCNESDFSILKTVDKKLEHDAIYEQICEKLKWKFIPIL